MADQTAVIVMMDEPYFTDSTTEFLLQAINSLHEQAHGAASSLPLRLCSQEPCRDVNLEHGSEVPAGPAPAVLPGMPR